MLVSFVYLCSCRVLGLIVALRRSETDNNIEIAVLRHQVRVLERQLGRRVVYRRADGAWLAALSLWLPRARWGAFLVTPHTLMRWHRELVRRKWTHPQRGGGRPPLSADVLGLIVRLARENVRWGVVRIQGELRKLGIRISASSVRRVLRGQRIGPAPRRAAGPTWMEFLRAQAAGTLAVDFSPWTPCGCSRSTSCSGSSWTAGSCTSSGSPRTRTEPGSPRPPGNLMAELGGRAGTVKFLIRDRDAKFTRAFDEVFRAEGARVLLTPVQAPRAHCFAERWVRTARTECTDWILIRGRRHLEGVLQVYGVTRQPHNAGPGAQRPSMRLLRPRRASQPNTRTIIR